MVQARLSIADAITQALHVKRSREPALGAAVVATPGAAVVVTPGAAVVVTSGAAVVVNYLSVTIVVLVKSIDCCRQNKTGFSL